MTKQKEVKLVMGLLEVYVNRMPEDISIQFVDKLETFVTQAKITKTGHLELKTIATFLEGASPNVIDYLDKIHVQYQDDIHHRIVFDLGLELITFEGWYQAGKQWYEKYYVYRIPNEATELKVEELLDEWNLLLQSFLLNEDKVEIKLR